MTYFNRVESIGDLEPFYKRKRVSAFDGVTFIYSAIFIKIVLFLLILILKIIT